MFNSLSAFNSTTKSAYDALKSNPKMPISKFREVIAKSTPYGSMAAYKASFKEQAEAVQANTHIKFLTDTSFEEAAGGVNIEKTMQNEFNRVSQEALLELIDTINRDQFNTAFKHALNDPEPKEFYNYLCDHVNGMYPIMRNALTLKPSKHNIGLLMYVLPDNYIQKGKDALPINAKWEDALLEAYYYKMVNSLFYIFELLDSEYLRETTIKDKNVAEYIEALKFIVQGFKCHNDTATQTNKPIDKMKIDNIDSERLMVMLCNNRDLVSIISDRWDDTDGEEWSDNDIIKETENSLGLFITTEHPLFETIKKFFNQQLNFYVTGYMNEEDYNDTNGEVFHHDPYTLLRDAQKDYDFKKLIQEEGFYKITIVSTSGGEYYYEDYTAESFK